MNRNILKTGVQEFIQKNWNTDIVSVLLKKQLFEGVLQKELAEQLEAKKKCKNKLPTWFATPEIYYPNKLNIEQTSSEQTAKYKANLVGGKSLLDTTGGLGIDSYYFAQKINAITHCELDQKLSEIVQYNAKKLGVKNIDFYTGDGIDFLSNSDKNFDWIYSDPSRRNDAKEKVFLLADCTPDIPKHLDQIFSKTKNLLLKTSPIFDIQQGLRELKYVKEIHVVAVQNEVKELLWILEKGYTQEPSIKTSNLSKTQIQNFDFTNSKEKEQKASLGLPKKYLYEPNAAILKAGAFKLVGKRLELYKLHEHSHLYTSDKLVDFPGRRFNIKAVIPYNKKAIAKLKLKKANITTRNFPESVATIRKKHQIKDGGTDYLFFSTNVNNQKVVVYCQKV